MRLNFSDLVTTPASHAAGILGAAHLRNATNRFGTLASLAIITGASYVATQHGGGLLRRIGQGGLASVVLEVAAPYVAALMPAQGPQPA